MLLTRIEDPRLKGVSLTRVKMTSDLKIARVYFSMIADEPAIARAQQALEKAGRIFRRAIGDNLDLRYIPELEFFYDKNLDHAQRIETILKQIHDQEPPPDEEGD